MTPIAQRENRSLEIRQHFRPFPSIKQRKSYNAAIGICVCCAFGPLKNPSMCVYFSYFLECCTRFILKTQLATFINELRGKSSISREWLLLYYPAGSRPTSFCVLAKRIYCCTRNGRKSHLDTHFSLFQWDWEGGSHKIKSCFTRGYALYIFICSIAVYFALRSESTTDNLCSIILSS